jgi:hypothetical protein
MLTHFSTWKSAVYTEQVQTQLKLALYNLQKDVLPALFTRTPRRRVSLLRIKALFPCGSEDKTKKQTYDEEIERTPLA